MLADDFAKSSPEEISGDGLTGLFGGNEAKISVFGTSVLEHSENKILSRSRLTLGPNDLKLAPLAHTPLTGQFHDRNGSPK